MHTYMHTYMHVHMHMHVCTCIPPASRSLRMFMRMHMPHAHATCHMPHMHMPHAYVHVHMPHATCHMPHATCHMHMYNMHNRHTHGSVVQAYPRASPTYPFQHTHDPILTPLGLARWAGMPPRATRTTSPRRTRRAKAWPTA